MCLHPLPRDGICFVLTECIVLTGGTRASETSTYLEKKQITRNKAAIRHMPVKTQNYVVKNLYIFPCGKFKQLHLILGLLLLSLFLPLSGILRNKIGYVSVLRGGVEETLC
jgi:hypothetical protein